jgi:hypothetical protein
MALPTTREDVDDTTVQRASDRQAPSNAVRAKSSSLLHVA